MGGKKKNNFLNSGCKRKISRIDFKLLQKGMSLCIAASVNKISMLVTLVKHGAMHSSTSKA